MMNKYLFGMLVLLLALAKPATAQNAGFSDKIKAAEQARLSGDFDAARRHADDAYQLAKKSDSNEGMAMALHEGAKAFAEDSKGSSRNRRRAERMLRESSKLTQDAGLRSKNAALLALLDGKEASGNATADASQSTAAAPPSPQGRAAENEKRRKDMDAQIANLSIEKVALEKAMRGKEKELEAMSEAQLRQSFLLSQQKNLLDSLSIEVLGDSLLLTRTTMELQERDNQIALQSSQRNLLIVAVGAALLIALGLFFRYRTLQRLNKLLEQKNKDIAEAQQRSEELLLNILPAAVAAELRSNGFASAKQHELITVLFTDFADFSRIAANMSPDLLVKELDYCFSAFDKISEHYQLEKIKTIGDAYMCAGGLVPGDTNHPVRVVQAALEMHDFIEKWKAERAKSKMPYFEMRIGIHSGPAVAGVVGIHKFAYDIWGNTVNVAARMEAGSQPGKINISGSTYELVKEQFQFTSRGHIPAKNIGDVAMYFVETP